ncbi:MAG: ribosome assembly RNA-binding protein YhbY [Erysipelothrix sp.]|nr:ribosome assembly RNA-binding protein YhbY [Erysipelothrix sp.]
MLKANQKKQLKALAHDLKPIIQIGKDGLSDNLLTTIEQALKAHELIKISVLQNNNDITEELILDISSRTRSEFVFKIGRQLIFYRASKQKLIKLV